MRWTRAPGPLREAAGLSYQEFSTLRQPLRLEATSLALGDADTASTWADMLIAEKATVLATYAHPFFGRFPALTRNAFGKGTVTYEGSFFSDSLQEKVLRDVLARAGVSPAASGLPPRGARARGHRAHRNTLRFFLNFSAIDAVVRLAARRRDEPADRHGRGAEAGDRARPVGCARDDRVGGHLANAEGGTRSSELRRKLEFGSWK